jgi:GDPmannose 4,6-dehydratase
VTSVALTTDGPGNCANLAKFLLKKRCEVHRIKRCAWSFDTTHLDHLYQDPHGGARNLILHYGDVTYSSNLTRFVQLMQPEETYNLSEWGYVAVRFDEPEYTANADDRSPKLSRLSLKLSKVTSSRTLSQDATALSDDSVARCQS